MPAATNLKNPDQSVSTFDKYWDTFISKGPHVKPELRSFCEGVWNDARIAPLRDMGRLHTKIIDMSRTLTGLNTGLPVLDNDEHVLDGDDDDCL
jgi:hypothetical protein